MSAAMDQAQSLNILAQVVNVKYIFFSAVILLIYDTIITLSDEIHLIWLQRWSLGKFLYLVVRYSSYFDEVVILLFIFSDTLSDGSCRAVYETADWMMTMGIIVCQAALILRAYAIWERNNMLLVYLAFVQLGALIATALKVHYSDKFLITEPTPSGTPAYCLPVLGNNGIFINYCVCIFVELTKALSHWKKVSTSLVHTLFRDGVVYFVILFSISVMNLIFTVKAFNTPYFYIATQHLRVLHSILTSRVILNVRKVAFVDEMSMPSIKGVAPSNASRFCERLSQSIDFAHGVTRIPNAQLWDHWEDNLDLEDDQHSEQCFAESRSTFTPDGHFT
ncbi:hypothetical protein SCHPADRAFT_943470 [Schizopora paradoxa]|uniref:DUF6533 domain-containing protein n=1 Tax=Schizopora paradoxa TaxID=27342 RepID=A0A0H2RJN5_9AGAM|nr:hypothetical protein SCHPADRAFT_943470 [Schizopora paradoxa]